MAIINGGTANDVPSVQIPVGYSRPTVARILDFNTASSLILTVLKATVENADPIVTMGNIINNATIGITKQIDDILAAIYLASPTVTAYASLKSITTNLEGTSGSDDIFKATATSYRCEVELFVKSV